MMLSGRLLMSPSHGISQSHPWKFQMRDPHRSLSEPSNVCENIQPDDVPSAFYESSEITRGPF
jgi:hypothetical protein